MMTTRSTRTIDGVLTTKDGGVLKVRLDVVTVALSGQHGVAAEEVATVALATTGVPDGEYTLGYFCSATHSALVRVKDGILRAAGPPV
jgi:hypothetical protein